MKKKVSRELQALEHRIENLKQAVNSKKGNLDYQWERVMDSAKAAQKFRLKDRGRFPKDTNR